MTEDYQKLFEDSKSYLKTRYDLLRLDLLDKLSFIVGLLVLIIVALFVALTALAFFSVAIVGWLAQCMSMSVACCILGGVLLLILLIIYFLRRRLFVDPFIRLFSKKLFTDKENVENHNPKKDETDV